MMDHYPAEKYGRAVELLELARDLDEGLSKAAWELMHAGRGSWKNPELRKRHDALLQAMQQREADLTKDRAIGRTERGYDEAKRLEREMRTLHGALRAEWKYG